MLMEQRPSQQWFYDFLSRRKTAPISKINNNTKKKEQEKQQQSFTSEQGMFAQNLMEKLSQ